MVTPALPPLPRPEPLHKIQYVVEIVGPRSLNAGLVRPLAEPAWRAAAGEPHLYVMGPADERWRPLEQEDSTGSYDSLALSWDLLGARGNLNSSSAAHLLDVAERYAEQVQRRAIPLPVPEEVNARVQGLREIVEGLDIGVAAVAVFPGLGIADGELAGLATELGLRADPEGFEWWVPGWDEPVLAMHRGLDDPHFSASAPQASRSAVSVGFSLPRSPAPSEVLEAMVSLLGTLATRFGAQCVIDDEVQDPAMLRRFLPQALAAFQGVGIVPGSAEARSLFPGG